jgi:hypothetical protein
MSGDFDLLFLKDYYIVVYCLLFITLMISLNVKGAHKLSKLKTIVTTIAVVVIALMYGLRSENVGVDTQNYIYMFEYEFVSKNFSNIRLEYAWVALNVIISYFTSNATWLFLVVAFGYVTLPIIGFKKIFNGNVLYMLLMTLISPNFFLYGANGIRQGLAASIFLFSFLYYGRRKQWIVIIISVLMHNSMVVPAFLYWLFSMFYSRKIYIAMLLAWFIFLLFNIFGLDFTSVLMEMLTTVIGEAKDTFTMNRSVGLKILNIPVQFFYSAIVVFLGAFFILSNNKKYDYPFYRTLNFLSQQS